MYVLNAGTKYNVLRSQKKKNSIMCYCLPLSQTKKRKKKEYGTRYLSTVRIKILQFLTNLVY